MPNPGVAERLLGDPAEEDELAGAGIPGHGSAGARLRRDAAATALVAVQRAAGGQHCGRSGQSRRQSVVRGSTFDDLFFQGSRRDSSTGDYQFGSTTRTSRRSWPRTPSEPDRRVRPRRSRQTP